MTALPPFDLDAYLARIGHTGPADPTLDTLRAIHRRHPAAIAFENLDSLTGRVPSLDLADIQRKLVVSARGGYCFEQNLLLRAALDAIGFRVAGLAARVVWNTPERPTPPRSHMLLKIDLDGDRYVADVGFGGMTPTAPFRLAEEGAQETPHGAYRLIRRGAGHRLEARIQDAWSPLYDFDLTEQAAADYDVGNWYVATHPASPFVNALVCARTDDGRRYALRNNELSIHAANGPTRRVALETPDDLRKALEDVFMLNLKDVRDLDRVLLSATARA